MSHTRFIPFPVMRVYLVRHGETNENREGIIQGQMDTVLNEDGTIQAHLCANALKDIDFAIAFSSDLQRAVQTAQIILSRHPDTPSYTDPLLRERDMAELQGVKIGQYDRTKLPKSVETGQQFARRTITWWTTTIEQQLPTLPIQRQPFNVLVVSHGAYITTLCRELVLSRRIDALDNIVPGTCLNTSITTIAMRRDKRGTLERFADISHLLQPAVETNADEIPSEQDTVENTQNNEKIKEGDSA